MYAEDIKDLVQILSRMPGLGPRSGRRLALQLLKKRDTLLRPLNRALHQADMNIQTCTTCGYLDTINPCSLCVDPKRDPSILCVLADVADVWAFERTQSYNGLYHILGGLLSASDGVGIDQLNIKKLIERLNNNPPSELIIGLSATMEGQTTLDYLQQLIKRDVSHTIHITTLAHGVPVGGEIDYLDDNTLHTALKERRAV